MAVVLRSSKAYLEKKGYIETRRLPTPRLDLDANPINRYPLSPPYPYPGFFVGTSPDRGPAQTWPPT